MLSRIQFMPTPSPKIYRMEDLEPGDVFHIITETSKNMLRMRIKRHLCFREGLETMKPTIKLETGELEFVADSTEVIPVSVRLIRNKDQPS